MGFYHYLLSTAEPDHVPFQDCCADASPGTQRTDYTEESLTKSATRIFAKRATLCEMHQNRGM